MKHLCVLLCSLFWLSTANAVNPSAAMNRSEMLQWSKKQIIQQARSVYSQNQINTSLKDFPVIIEDSCDAVKLVFVKNSVQCGNVNCKYLTFLASPTKYQYLAEIGFAAEHLICYPDSANNYLVTSQQETNASSIIYLNKIVGDKLVRVANLSIDLTDNQQKDFFESLWDKKLSENNLVKGFEH